MFQNKSTIIQNCPLDKVKQIEIHNKGLQFQTLHHTGIRKFEKKGLILVMPLTKHPRTIYYHNELLWIGWFLQQTIYLANAMSLFPTGFATLFELPKCTYKRKLQLPRFENYVIEPDWNSA